MWSFVTSRGQRVPLRSLPAVVGSGEAADVVLPHPSIAPTHMRIEAADGDRLRVTLLDEEALLEAGGRKVAEAELSDGDELVLGRVRLKVVNAAATPAQRPRAAAEPEVPEDGELVVRGGTTAAAASRPGGSGGGGRAAGRGARAGGGATRSAARDGGDLRSRERGLLVVERDQRRGLLHTDLSQVSGGAKALLVLALLVVGGALLWAVQFAVAELL